MRISKSLVASAVTVAGLGVMATTAFASVNANSTHNASTASPSKVAQTAVVPLDPSKDSGPNVQVGSQQNGGADTGTAAKESDGKDSGPNVQVGSQQNGGADTETGISDSGK